MLVTHPFPFDPLLRLLEPSEEMPGIHNDDEKVFHKDLVNLVKLEGINRYFVNRRATTIMATQELFSDIKETTLPLEENMLSGRTSTTPDKDILGG